jgi:hypothetical protein
MKNVALFEVDAVDVDRFFCVPLGLDSEVRLVFIDEPAEYEIYQKSGLLRGERVHLSAWKTINELQRMFIAHKIDLLILDASRIVDMYISLAARAAGVKIAYIQHGMYIPFMKRNAAFFVRKLSKTARYLTYAVRIGLHIRNLSLPVSLFRVHVIGSDRDILSMHRQLFPDHGVVFSEYWKKWHEQHYAFPPDILSTIGSPDLNKHRFGPAPAGHRCCILLSDFG